MFRLLFCLTIFIGLMGGLICARADWLGDCFSGGCDVVWQLNKRWDSGMRSKSESLVGPAKEAFEQAMADLFDKRITPLIGNIDFVVASRLNQAGSIIQDAENGMDQLIKIASDVVDHQIDHVKEKIIDATFSKADQLLENINKRILGIIDAGYCAALGTTAGIAEWIKSEFSFLPHPFDSCYKANGHGIWPPSGDDLFAIYRIRQCQMEQDLATDGTIQGLRDGYARLEVWARRMQCAMKLANIANSLIKEDVERYESAFSRWTLISGGAQK
jgi:hypothetical protein